MKKLLPNFGLNPAQSPSEPTATCLNRGSNHGVKAVCLISVTVLLAAIGTLAFGALHAILIVPIWRRLVGGFPFALLAAAAITLSYRHLRRVNKIGHGFWPALGFGVLLWLSVLPTTAFGAFLRATRFHQQNGTIEVIGSVLVAAATGALIGRSLRLRSWWLAAAALLPVALVVAMAGPIPVNNGRRPVLLLLGFLPIFVAAALLAALMTVEDRALADAPLRPG